MVSSFINFKYFAVDPIYTISIKSHQLAVKLAVAHFLSCQENDRNDVSKNIRFVGANLLAIIDVKDYK